MSGITPGLMLAPPFFKLQTDAAISQAAPGDGTQYTVLDTVENVRIISVWIECTWTVQPDPLELHGTLDGLTLKAAVTNPVSTQNYYLGVNPDLALNAQALTTTKPIQSFIYDCRSVQLLAEVSGGTVQNLSCRVRYARYY